MTAAAPLVLVVEDEPQIRHFVAAAVQREGWRVAEAAAGHLGLEAAARQAPDLVVLDLGLPDMDGVAFLGELRAWSRAPVLILSARAAEADKIAALDAGADDYLAKPFGVGELLARARALLRRRAAGGDGAPWHRFGEVEVDLARHRVCRDGAELHLTQIEYRLLAVLLANEGKVMTHRQLMREVWGPGREGQSHYLRIYVGRLRQRLERDPAQPRHILTETGVGYRFQS